MKFPDWKRKQYDTIFSVLREIQDSENSSRNSIIFILTELYMVFKIRKSERRIYCLYKNVSACYQIHALLMMLIRSSMAKRNVAVKIVWTQIVEDIVKMRYYSSHFCSQLFHIMQLVPCNLFGNQTTNFDLSNQITTF